MNTIYLQLGSNMGDRGNYLNYAREQIRSKIGEIVIESSKYESSPWGVTNQRNFLNQAICIESSFTAKKILRLSQNIEKKIGRKKNGKWKKRVIDIDILFYNSEIITTNMLKIPHPLLHERLFVLVPLSEIASNFIHPIYNKNIKTLFMECEDRKMVEKYDV